MHNFFPFQKLCIKGKHWCNFVPYFEILHHNPTCAYVRTLLLGLCTLRPRAQLRTIFRSCTCLNNQCETFEFIYKLCTSNVHRLSFEPYLRVMTGNSQFNVRYRYEFFEVIPHASTTSGPLNELCTTSPRVQNFVFKLLVLNKNTLRAQLFFLFKSCASKDNLV